MNKRMWILGGLLVAAVVVGGSVGGMAIATGLDNETPITGVALEKASEAALDHTGGGRVSGTEVGDEESYYEVEVTLDGGGQVDVQLDENFNVVGDKVDNESEDEGGASD